MAPVTARLVLADMGVFTFAADSEFGHVDSGSIEKQINAIIFTVVARFQTIHVCTILP